MIACCKNCLRYPEYGADWIHADCVDLNCVCHKLDLLDKRLAVITEFVLGPSKYKIEPQG